MKYKLVLLSLVLLILENTYAQESRTITLAEAVDLGLKNSKQLKYNTAKIQEAAAQLKMARENKLPDVNISANYLYLPLKPVVDLKTGSGNGGTPSISQAMYGTANVSLPVYSGGRINYGIKSAGFLEKAVELDSINDRQGIMMNLVSAAVNLFKANTAIQLFKENLAQSQQRVKDLTNLEKNGLLARNDLMKAALQSSNIELSLLDAESNYNLASINLNIMMGLPEEIILIPDKSGLSLPVSIKTVQEYEQDALQNRSDIGALSYRKKSAVLGVSSVKAEKLPGISLTGGYIAADIPKLFSVYNAVNIGVGIRYNLGSLWKNKSAVQQAEAKVKQADANEEMLSDNIRMQINKAYQTYLVSIKKIDVYKQAVEQATENYRITKNKFDNALATTTDLLEADVALLQVRLSVTNAQADSYLAYSHLLETAGVLQF